MKDTILAQAFVLLALATTGASAEVQLDSLKMPPGFAISIYADGVENARQMTLGKNGVLYVGSRRAGKVHAVIDRDGDYHADEVIQLAENLTLPSGVTWHDGDLYVAAVSTIYRFEDIDEHLAAPPKPTVLVDNLPDKLHHGWKFIEFGPDGRLYIPVGAPCNLCLSDDPRFATILSIDVKNPKAPPTTIALGVRNSVGFDWHPVTGELWFTDNGRDLMGDDVPPCELNRVSSPGQHFGYPFFHGNTLADPEFGKGRKAADYVEPALALGPHTAPLGMAFYTGRMFPASFHNQVILAEHGSWNRSAEAGHTGYRLIHAREDSNGKLHEDVLVDGWLQNNKAWGRPADVLQLPDGSLLVSDDTANVIYRITYSKS